MGKQATIMIVIFPAKLQVQDMIVAIEEVIQEDRACRESWDATMMADFRYRC
jgi:hypothetical protein